MDNIKISHVDNITFIKNGIHWSGTLHLTTHHLIFTSKDLKNEFWFPYALISHCIKMNWNNGFYLKILGKEYSFFLLRFNSIDSNYNNMLKLVELIMESISHLTVLSQVNELYAFYYIPNKWEKKLISNNWQIYSLESEFKRQGLFLDEDSKVSQWRISDMNNDYKFIPTYPSKLIVPKTLSDTTIQYAAKFRSKNRFPVISYFYKRNNCTISRSSQPMPGLTFKRSIQDENLISHIFNNSKKNLIIDCRPMTNAMAQRALGGGTENMDYYNFDKTTKRIFLGIDNIHVMSNAMNSLTDGFLSDTIVINNGQKLLPNMINKKAMYWLKSVKLILNGVDTLIKSIVLNSSNLLIHCSDGWDRTAQISSLVQICIDPFFRTMEGFMVLVEKDWCSFGHKFNERSGHLSSNELFQDEDTFNINDINNKLNNTLNSLTSLSTKNNNNVVNCVFNDNTVVDDFENMNTVNINNSSLITSKNNTTGTNVKFISPIFQQFLDCVYQLLEQDPSEFEFNEIFLRRLVYHVYSCQYGTFLYNCEREKIEMDVQNKTRSVWDYFQSRKDKFINKSYSPKSNDDDNWIQPNLNDVKWWYQLYGRKDFEMNRSKNSNFIPTENNIPSHDDNILNSFNDFNNTNNIDNAIITTTKNVLSTLNIFNKKDNK